MVCDLEVEITRSKWISCGWIKYSKATHTDPKSASSQTAQLKVSVRWSGEPLKDWKRDSNDEKDLM
jgi:hypothetical protein